MTLLVRKKVLTPAVTVVTLVSAVSVALGLAFSKVALALPGLLLAPALGTWFLLAGMDRMQHPRQLLLRDGRLVLRRGDGEESVELRDVYLDRVVQVRAGGGLVARNLLVRMPKEAARPIDVTSPKSFRKTSRRLRLASMHYIDGPAGMRELASAVQPSPY